MRLESKCDEFALIRRLTKAAERPLPSGVVGPGDDAAVIPIASLTKAAGQNGFLLVSTDTIVEDVHFSTSISSPSDIGWKLAAVNISDIAAMGGNPLYATISCELTSSTEEKWADELYAGLQEAFSKYDVHLIGGDTVCGKEISLGLTIFGISPEHPILRGGAREGDDIWVSGEIGGAAIGLKQGLEARCKDSEFLKRHRRPEPRVHLGSLLAQHRLASSMIDVSDGLIADAGHLAEMSARHFVVHLEKVPFAQSALLNQAEMLVGGDDYELLFTSEKKNRELILDLVSKNKVAGTIPEISLIGEVSADKSDYVGVSIREPNEKAKTAAEYLANKGIESKGGYQHFRLQK